MKFRVNYSNGGEPITMAIIATQSIGQLTVPLFLIAVSAKPTKMDIKPVLESPTHA